MGRYSLLPVRDAGGHGNAAARIGASVQLRWLVFGRQVSGELSDTVTRKLKRGEIRWRRKKDKAADNIKLFLASQATDSAYAGAHNEPHAEFK